MTLIGQHAKSDDNVSDNSREGVKNGNVDKSKVASKKTKSIFVLKIFLKQKTWSPPKFNFEGLHVFCF